MEVSFAAETTTVMHQSYVSTCAEFLAISLSRCATRLYRFSTLDEEATGGVGTASDVICPSVAIFCTYEEQ